MANGKGIYLIVSTLVTFSSCPVFPGPTTKLRTCTLAEVGFRLWSLAETPWAPGAVARDIQGAQDARARPRRDPRPQPVQHG